MNIYIYKLVVNLKRYTGINWCQNISFFNQTETASSTVLTPLFSIYKNDFKWNCKVVRALRGTSSSYELMGCQNFIFFEKIVF